MRASALVLMVSAAAVLARSPLVAQSASSGTSSARGIPAGTYETRIRRADGKGRLTSTPVDSMVGNWTLTFDEKGHVTVVHGKAKIAEADMQLQPGQRVYFDGKDTGEGGCKTPATYRYTVRGKQLTFRNIGRDECDGRLVVLTSHALRRTS
jgi:uncharacterized cupin superfamily protein